MAPLSTPFSDKHYAMTIADLKSNGLLLFECISGSRAYGTDIPTSDTDIKGVFMLPRKQFYGLEYIAQVNSEKNDEVYYEIGRFAELLSKSNPNILEMLATPSDCILYCHPLFEPFLKENFLSKACKDTFAGFAFAQIKKAKGLNKKINIPMAPVRKGPLDFCYIALHQGSVPLQRWLDQRGWNQDQCGLAAIPNMRDLFGLYHDSSGQWDFSGIVKKDTSNEVALSSIPKGMEPAALMSFNKDAWSMHCRDFRDYQEWLEQRNEERFQNTLTHGKNYDAKNMMHTIRLLDMAAEILKSGTLQVRRPNREHLLRIRSGDFLYEELLAEAEQKQQQIEQLFTQTTLPEHPDQQRIEDLLIGVREGIYT